MRTVPAMLYDGECAFCSRWIQKWQRATGSRIQYFPYQEALADYPEVTESQCRKSVQLILPDGTVIGGAKAVFKSLSFSQKRRWLLWMYEQVPLFALVSEWFYGLIARHRSFFSRFL